MAKLCNVHGVAFGSLQHEMPYSQGQFSIDVELELTRHAKSITINLRQIFAIKCSQYFTTAMVLIV